MKYIQNEFLSVEIGEYGEITKIADQKSGEIFLDSPHSEGFRIKMDPTQSNIWKTNPDSDKNICLPVHEMQV